MYIFNTTYHIDNAVKELFISWLRESYISEAVAGGVLSRPQLCRVIGDEEGDGESYSLQFHVSDPECLERWYDEVGAGLDGMIHSKFGDRVLGFNTLLEIID